MRALIYGKTQTYFLNDLVLLAPGNKGNVLQYDIISVENNFQKVSSILVYY